MNKILSSAILMLIMCGIAFAQLAERTDENPTPEQLAAFDRSGNRESRLQLEIKKIRVFLELYQQEQGKWPESWAEVERKYGPSVWESPQDRETFIRSFVLVPGVSGHIAGTGGYDATMLMVMASPIERETSQNKRELGRWAVWKSNGGQIVTQWHAEPEVISFSAWPEVQLMIDRHIKTAGVAEPSRASVSSEQIQAQQSVATLLPKSVATAAKEKLASSTPWAVAVMTIVAMTGLLWLLFKKRR